MNRTFLHPLLALAAGATAWFAACTGTVTTDIPNPTTFAPVRVLVLTEGTGRVAAVFQVKGELPGTFDGLVAPAVSPFQPIPAGSASVSVLSDGRLLATAPEPVALVKDARHTLVVSGSSDKPQVALVSETPLASSAAPRIRAIDASGLGATLRWNDQPLAMGSGKPSDWQDSAVAADAKVSVFKGSDLVATFSKLSVAAGEQLTVVLLGRPPEVPVQLLLVRDTADGKSVSERRDFDGAELPSARVRFLHLSQDAGTVSVAQVDGPTLATGLNAQQLSADATLPVGRAVEVRFETAGSEPVRFSTEKWGLEKDGTYTLALVGLRDPEALLGGLGTGTGTGLSVGTGLGIGSGTGTATGSGPTLPSLPLQWLVWRDDRTPATQPTARLAVALPPLLLPGTLEVASEDGATVLLPATAAGAASVYTALKAWPATSLLRARIALCGATPLALGSVTGLQLPADRRVTLVATGTVLPRPALQLMMIDDQQGVIGTTPVVNPLALPEGACAPPRPR